jgi:D-inositol-3-phosphate glycosyltransferase
VGGLPVAIADGVSGQLVASHQPVDWADALSAVALQPVRRQQLAAGATGHARRFSWERTTEALLQVYADAAAAYRVEVLQREVAV